MPAQDIEYVELYASDKQGAVDYFVLSLGFTKMAESIAFGKDSTLLRQGGVQLIVSGGPATEEFVYTHGDGIADIAFGCDDVAATCDAAVAAGGVVLNRTRDRPAVSGFGEVRHTLLPRTTSPGTRLPPGYRWVTVRGMPVRPTGRVIGLDHIAVCFEAGRMPEHIDFYRAAFELDWHSSEFIEITDLAMSLVVVRSRCGGITLTMQEPDISKNPGPLNSFLDRNNGAGVQHLAFRVDAVVPAADECRRRGMKTLDFPDADYETLSVRCPELRTQIAELRSAGVLADRDDSGYLLQLFARSPYERNTLFYELVQRCGTWGFGSANIEALYEALDGRRLVS